jgi:peptidoglycan hydrolase CwlO-like protein
MKLRPFLLLIVIFSSIFFVSNFVYAQSLTLADEARLKQELQQVEAEQKRVEADLANTQLQGASLQRDINILNGKIKAAQLKIKAKNLMIQTLGQDIQGKKEKIETLESRIDRGKETLAQIMRKTNEIGTYSLPELMLSQNTISSFFEDVDSLYSVQSSLKDTFENIRTDQAETNFEKEALDKRRNAEIDAKYAIQQEQKNIEADESEKKRLLTINKNNEKAYSSELARKKAQAATIRSQLFSLRDAAAIPFGDALKYAQLASAKTGVRPAFVLAILTQESALGKNVGSCQLSNIQNGDGVSVKTGNLISRVMSPTRDIPPFMQIVGALGRDPLKTIVSCPQSFGWGGAMGPAQFIASTWKLLENRVANALAISGIPDPWNPAHAFMASSMYLSDLGASSGTYTAERNAACKYYSGRNCSASATIASYGNSVISKADTIQRTMIDPLQGL